MTVNYSNQFPATIHIHTFNGHSGPKLYKLTYHGDVIIQAAAYPICVAKKNKLVQAGTHTAAAFEITRAG